MPGRPHLLENLTDDTRHARALEFLAHDAGTTGRPVAVATGYVNLGGLHHLAVTVADGRGVRLLLGAVPDPALGADLPIPRFERALRVLAAERDFARFPPSREAERLAALDAWLADPAVEVRRYVEQFLHGKAYLFGTGDDARAALVTSANLTAGGLFANLELGLVHYDPHVAGLALRWFDELWGGAADFKDALRALLFPDAGLVDPQTVYLRALLELYGDELDDLARPTPIAQVDLAPFQRDGFERALRIVATHHGVVYADGVGTGKTEVGLAFIEEYALRRGHHALVVAPAQLVARWEERIHQARLPAQVVTFQQLANDEQLAPGAPSARRHLANDRDSYRLVVIDEGHAFRNPDTTWYRALERLLGGERKDLVLLTATPINNGLWDLYHLVVAFARHDRAFAAHGIPSLRDLFRAAGANERDPESLDPDKLFPLADAVSVRRDRRFIMDRYRDATFSDGTPVRFPEPRMATVRYDIDGAYPGLVAEITSGIGSLAMARYRPSRYERGGGEDAGETALAALMQSQLLKRFESCWWACLRSLDRMVAAHDAFLRAWDDQGIAPAGDVLREAAALELDDNAVGEWLVDVAADARRHRPVAEFDPQFRADVAADRDVLARLRARLARLDAAGDPKLARLAELLDASPSQKIAVFATFGETVQYLDEHLPSVVGGRSRVTVIGGATDPDERTTLLARFCPATVVRDGWVPPGGEVDLLLSTDVLSEGQNLQQAAAVVSYDMPWNPQRVVQRNGRVIRLKSPHAEVSLTTMLPEPGELEAMLGLEAIIRRKIVAAGVYGMESAVLHDGDAAERELRAYATRLAAGDETLLDDDDPETGAGFSGEALRSELLRALHEGEIARLRALPWGIGATFRRAGTSDAGVFFACRTRDGRRYWRFVPRGDDELVTEVPEMLRRIDPAGAPAVELVGVDLDATWQRAVESIVAEHNELVMRREGESIGPAQRFALDVLRDATVSLPPGAAEAEGALSVERSSAVRRALSELRTQVADGEISRDEAAARVVAIVEEFGLREVEPAPVVMPITPDDVGVVCWMAVVP